MEDQRLDVGAAGGERQPDPAGRLCAARRLSAAVADRPDSSRAPRQGRAGARPAVGPARNQGGCVAVAMVVWVVVSAVVVVVAESVVVVVWPVGADLYVLC